MEETWKYQEGQIDKKEEMTQPATVADMLEQMRHIFADRDEEYTRMESAYQKRKEALDAKEAALQETLAGMDQRLSELTDREEAVKEKEEELQKGVQTLAVEKAAMQEAQAKLEKEKTEQWMQVSLAREEARNEKLRSQRLAREYEEKLSRLPADDPNYFSRQGELEQALHKIKQENALLQTENQRLTEANRELKEATQNLPELQKEDLESLHALAKELTEEKESLTEENQRLMEANKHLEEENRRLQEEKGELFRKLMGQENVTEKNWQGDVLLKEETVLDPDESLEDKGETGAADFPWPEECPLTAKILQEYFSENEIHARLLHSRDGELVAVTLEGLNVMFSFRETPRFDIRKKQKGGWGMKKLIKRYNENEAGLVFSYDETEEELIGSGEFSLSMSPEELVHKVYQAARIYFGYQDEGEK